MKLEQEIAAIEAAQTIDDLRKTLHLTIQNYGFSGFTFIDAGHPELDVPFYTGTHPPAWERAYLQNGFVHADPALARVRRTNAPFTWTDIKLPPQLGRIRPPQRKMMEAARDFGFTEGLVVPLHYRDQLGAMHSSSTVFFWEDNSDSFRILLAAHRHELHLIMIYWIQRAMQIVDAQRRKPRSILQPLDELATIQLTAREREVMAWAARGKTTADTAEILGLSAETVTDFIKQAMRKLGASNKTHGVAKSIALGLIDF